MRLLPNSRRLKHNGAYGTKPALGELVVVGMLLQQPQQALAQHRSKSERVENVTFDLTNVDLKSAAEPGDFKVFEGTDSSNVKESKFTRTT